MSVDQDPSAMADPNPPRACVGERRVRDRRAPWRMWLPTYVLEYLDRIGSNGFALYGFLAWHCTRESPIRWPSINQLAHKMNVSRSTIERTMRALREVGLVATSPCFDAQGQHSNYFDLVDPPEYREQSGSHGAPDAGAVSGDGAPPSPAKGGPVTTEGGAPSPLTAPPVKNRSEECVCEEARTHTPRAAQTPDEDGGEIAQLSALWSAQMRGGAPHWRTAMAAEMSWAVELLLARGWTNAQIAEAIEDRRRDPNEWPRELVKRLGSRPAQEARTSPDRAKERQERSKAAETLAADRQTGSYKAALAKLRAAIGKPVDPAADEG